MPWFFAREAEPEEQGGHSDLTSKITYCNESKEETLNQAALFKEYYDGAEALDKEYDNAKNAPDDARFNTTIMETDSHGHNYPARHGPGK